MAQRQTLKILFYPRNDKARSDTEVPIYMRITINGNRSEMALHRLIDPDKWNIDGGFLKGTKQEVRELNEFLDIHRSKVYTAQRELIDKGKPVTAVNIRNLIQGKTEGCRLLLLGR